jgi:peptidoglycan/xylan/chitin deacetylase (PgdA/CDA1 family)
VGKPEANELSWAAYALDGRTSDVHRFRTERFSGSFAPGAFIVDVGCGDGWLLNEVVGRGCRGLGTEVYDKLVRALRMQRAGRGVRVRGLMRVSAVPLARGLRGLRGLRPGSGAAPAALAKSVLLAASALSGVSAVVGGSRWRRSRLLILCYHGVSLADEHAALPELYMPPDLFGRRLEHLRSRGCNVLPLGPALGRLREGTLPPRSVALTFDDGTQDFAARVVPLLREFGAPATVYIATYYSGRGQPIFDTALRYVLWRGRASGAELGDLLPAPARRPLRVASAAGAEAAWAALFRRSRAEDMTADAKDALLRCVARRVGVDHDAFVASGMFQVMSPGQVRALPRDLVDVQLHTHRHRVPAARAAFEREIADNRAHLLPMGVASATHFCYPNGECRAEAAGWLRGLGVESATTCVPGIAAPHTDPMLLPRFVDTSYVSDATFDAWLSGVADLLPRRRANRFDPARLRAADAPAGCDGPGGAPSADRLSLAAEEVHQHELPERHRAGEVRLAAGDLAHPLHKFNERAVARQPERVDHDPRPPAAGDLAQRLAQDARV